MSPPTTAAAAAIDVPEQASSAPDATPLMDHSYDGIHEYDNPLPGWWRAIFWVSIVFAAGYWVWFHVGGWGHSEHDAYSAKLAIYNEGKQQREAADARDVSEDMLSRSSADPKTNDQGRAIFTKVCASCHTENGRGLIGPNLTDGFQMHGTTRMDILKTVRAGVPGTAMLAWGEQMAAPEVIAVAAFVISLRNTNVAGKEPQGAPVERFAK